MAEESVSCSGQSPPREAGTSRPPPPTRGRPWRGSGSMRWARAVSSGSSDITTVLGTLPRRCSSCDDLSRRLLVVGMRLDLEGERRVARGIQERLQRGDALALADVDRLHLLQGRLGDRQRPGRSGGRRSASWMTTIVAVGGALDVELEPVCSVEPGLPDCGERVLGRMRLTGTVRDELDPRGIDGAPCRAGASTPRPPPPPLRQRSPRVRRPSTLGRPLPRRSCSGVGSRGYAPQYAASTSELSATVDGEQRHQSASRKLSPISSASTVGPASGPSPIAALLASALDALPPREPRPRLRAAIPAPSLSQRPLVSVSAPAQRRAASVPVLHEGGRGEGPSQRQVRPQRQQHRPQAPRRWRQAPADRGRRRPRDRERRTRPRTRAARARSGGRL